jgi:hypothetical protein
MSDLIIDENEYNRLIVQLKEKDKEIEGLLSFIYTEYLDGELPQEIQDIHWKYLSKEVMKENL